MIWLFSFHSDQMKPMVINFTLPLNLLPNRWNLIGELPPNYSTSPQISSKTGVPTEE